MIGQNFGNANHFTFTVSRIIAFFIRWLRVNSFYSFASLRIICTLGKSSNEYERH